MRWTVPTRSKRVARRPVPERLKRLRHSDDGRAQTIRPIRRHRNSRHAPLKVIGGQS